MMIEAKGLARTYHVGEVEIPALRGVDLNIERGEYVAIVGKSGAGKSTLLYQLGLLDEPTRGTISLDNVDTSTLSPKERTKFRLTKLGYIFQDYALLPELTAEGNVMISLLMQGIPSSKAKERAQDVLGRMGLEERVTNLPSQLSGGEQQRVSIARAIVNKPLILFADEPTASLDSETSQVVLDYLQELHGEGQTIVMVTHEEDYSKQTGRIVRLSDGLLVSDEKTP